MFILEQPRNTESSTSWQEEQQIQHDDTVVNIRPKQVSLTPTRPPASFGTFLWCTLKRFHRFQREQSNKQSTAAQVAHSDAEPVWQHRSLQSTRWVESRVQQWKAASGRAPRSEAFHPALTHSFPSSRPFITLTSTSGRMICSLCPRCWCMQRNAPRDFV